jgi:hypothetical protein
VANPKTNTTIALRKITNMQLRASGKDKSHSSEIDFLIYWLRRNYLKILVVGVVVTIGVLYYFHYKETQRIERHRKKELEENNTVIQLTENNYKALVETELEDGNPPVWLILVLDSL